MKKWCRSLLVAGLLLVAGIAYAQPAPVHQVEMFRKPGIDFRQLKSVGMDVEVSLAPTADWAMERSDPFLKQRIQELVLKAAKKQGWIAAENEFADVKLSVKILEWGRLRNSKDANLMEFATFEVKAHSSAAEGLVFRGAGKYSRVDPAEQDLSKVNEAFLSIMEELMAALHCN